MCYTNNNEKINMFYIAFYKSYFSQGCPLHGSLYQIHYIELETVISILMVFKDNIRRNENNNWFIPI